MNPEHKLNRIKVNGKTTAFCERCEFRSELTSLAEIALAHEEFVAQQAYVDAGYKWGKDFMESYPIFKGELTFPSQTKNDDLWFAGALQAITELARNTQSTHDGVMSTVSVRWWN